MERNLTAIEHFRPVHEHCSVLARHVGPSQARLEDDGRPRHDAAGEGAAIQCILMAFTISGATSSWAHTALLAAQQNMSRNLAMIASELLHGRRLDRSWLDPSHGQSSRQQHQYAGSQDEPSLRQSPRLRGRKRRRRRGRAAHPLVMSSPRTSARAARRDGYPRSQPVACDRRARHGLRYE